MVYLSLDDAPGHRAGASLVGMHCSGGLRRLRGRSGFVWASGADDRQGSEAAPRPWTVRGTGCR